MNAIAAALEDCTAPLQEAIGPETFVPAAWKPGTVVAHRYRISRVLDTGGMATVYEATQLDLVRPVAIKVPRAGAANSPRVDRFECEARTLAELQHPHIVSVFELGRSEEGVTFMAMEFIQGPALRALLAAEGALPWRQGATIAAQLAEALQFAHEAGVVHGDVSARNVLLVRHGDTVESKLIDFGAARKVGDQPQHVWATRQYVAPELIKGASPHVLSDVYALGALLKEMVGDPLGSSPTTLQALIASMLDVDPLGRPESAGEVAIRLREILASDRSLPPQIPSLHVDPDDRLRRGTVAEPQVRGIRGSWAVAAGVAGIMLCALLVSGHRQSPPSQFVAAVSKPLVPTTGTPAPKVDDVRVATPAHREPPPQPFIRAARKTAPVAAATPARDSAPLASLPVQSAAANVKGGEEQATPEDDSVARADIVASLDAWLAAQSQNATGDSRAQSASRVGEPTIAFDPRGTSAGVTYRAVVMYSSGTHEIVEEQVFLAKHGEVWQMVEPGR